MQVVNPLLLPDSLSQLVASGLTREAIAQRVGVSVGYLAKKLKQAGLRTARSTAPARKPRTHCREGHPMSPDSTTCMICRKVARERYAGRQSEQAGKTSRLTETQWTDRMLTLQVEWESASTLRRVEIDAELASIAEQRRPAKRRTA